MDLAVCKACQNVFMVTDIRIYCPVCGGEPLVLEQEAPEESPAEETPQEEAPQPEEEAKPRRRRRKKEK